MAVIAGFSVSSSPSRIGVRGFYVPGTRTVLPVRAEVAPLLIGAALEFHRTVEPLVTGWCWGYAFRPVTKGWTPSFHAAGIAIDLNAPRHPYGRSGTFSSADAARCRAIARKYGLRWGGDYRRVKDEMHFEVHPNVGRSTALELVRRLQAGYRPTEPTKPTVKKTPTEVVVDSLPNLSLKGNAGKPWNKVGSMQALLCARGYNTKIDNDFGRHTDQQLRAFQRSRRLVADGICGQQTWQALLVL